MTQTTKREQRLTIRLAGPLIEQLSDLAAQENRPLADLVRIILVHHVVSVMAAASDNSEPDKRIGLDGNGATA